MATPALADTGDQLAKLLAPDGNIGDASGTSITIDATAALVGAPTDNSNGVISGSVYLFDRDTGVQTAKLSPSDGGSFDRFGLSVAMTDNLAVIGAPLDDDNGDASGSVYLFDSDSGVQIAELHASDGQTGDAFGFSIAISGTTLIVGAFSDDDNGLRSGAAYLIDATSSAVSAGTTVRNGSGQNALLLGKVTDPVLGSNWITDVDASGHVCSLVVLVVYDQPDSGFFLSSGEVLVDLSSSLEASLQVIHFGNVVQASVPIPADGSLFGLALSSQTAILGAPGLELSNALDLVLGY